MSQTANLHPSGIVTLSNGVMEVAVLPEHGGKILQITNLKTGREWLWSNPHLPIKLPDGNGRYVEEYDTGGWDECFPTIAPGPYPKGVFTGVETGNHGELWELPWPVIHHVEDDTGAIITQKVESQRFPISIERTLRLHPSLPVLDVDYMVKNNSQDSMGYLWAVHPLIPVGDGLKLCFPEGTTIRISALLGEWEGKFPVGLSVHPPVSLLDLVDPELVGRSPRGAKFFTDALPGNWGAVETPDGERLKFSFNHDAFDCIAVWINLRQWSGCGSEPYCNIGFEPMIGNSDSIADAVRDGLPHRLIPGGAIQRWSLRLLLE
jgi:hypothetical protein